VILNRGKTGRGEAARIYLAMPVFAVGGFGLVKVVLQWGNVRRRLIDWCKQVLGGIRGRRKKIAKGCLCLGRERISGLKRVNDQVARTRSRKRPGHATMGWVGPDFPWKSERDYRGTVTRIKEENRQEKTRNCYVLRIKRVPGFPGNGKPKRQGGVDSTWPREEWMEVVRKG